MYDSVNCQCPFESTQSFILMTVGLPLFSELLIVHFDLLVLFSNPLINESWQLRMFFQNMALNIPVEVSIIELSAVKIFVPTLFRNGLPFFVSQAFFLPPILESLEDIFLDRGRLTL